MLSGLDPLDEQVFGEALRLPAEWGAWEQLNASRLIPAVVRCTPDEGRRIRAREHEARIELVIVVPASPPEWRTVRGRPPMIPEFTVRPRIHTVADAVLVSAEGDRFPLLTVIENELRPLAASSPPTPGVRAGPEEIARFVEAEAEQQWQDLRTRCPRCGGLKKCRTCEGIYARRVSPVQRHVADRGEVRGVQGNQPPRRSNMLCLLGGATPLFLSGLR